MAQPGGKTTFNPLSTPFRPNWQMTALRLSDFGEASATTIHLSPQRLGWWRERGREGGWEGGIGEGPESGPKVG